MFESKSQPPISMSDFVRRLVRHALIGVGIITLSMLAGTLGFWALVRESPVDAFLNAAMLLGGMGPVGDLGGGGAVGKIFAALFSLYSGLVFLFVAGLLLAPLLHYTLHRFHWEDDEPPVGE